MSALATLTASAVFYVLGDEQVDEQICLSDDVIFGLKQEMAIQQQRIEEYENYELKSRVSQAPIKEEGMCSVDTTSLNREPPMLTSGLHETEPIGAR